MAVLINSLLVAEMYSYFRNGSSSLPQAILIEIEVTVVMTCRNLSAVHHVQGTAAVLLYALHEVTAVLAAAHVHIFNNLVIMTFSSISSATSWPSSLSAKQAGAAPAIVIFTLTSYIAAQALRMRLASVTMYSSIR